jgi:hypothetical protein
MDIKEQDIDAISTCISEKLYNWMSSWGSLLPPDVLCDYDGMMRFKKAMALIIKQELQK